MKITMKISWQRSRWLLMNGPVHRLPMAVSICEIGELMFVLIVKRLQMPIVRAMPEEPPALTLKKPEESHPVFIHCNAIQSEVDEKDGY